MPKELLRSVSKERNATHQELIQDYAHGPPVHWLPISLPQDHLRCYVFRGPAYLSTEKPGWLRVLRDIPTAGVENALRQLTLLINKNITNPRVPELKLLVRRVSVLPN